MHTYIITCVHTPLHMYMPTYIHTYSHTYIPRRDCLWIPFTNHVGKPALILTHTIKLISSHFILACTFTTSHRHSIMSLEYDSGLLFGYGTVLDEFCTFY
ncbi:hypothetical protein Hanom_Chr00s017060g01756721 [Helianthus anomalus]